MVCLLCRLFAHVRVPPPRCFSQTQRKGDCAPECAIHSELCCYLHVISYNASFYWQTKTEQLLEKLWLEKQCYSERILYSTK